MPMATYEDWSRSSKSLHERYVYSFDFEIDGKPITVKQENVIAAEDLVSELNSYIRNDILRETQYGME